MTRPMPLYHLLLDAELLHGRIRPALAAAWRGRSFEPCRPLCADLAPALRAFRERYHTAAEEHLVSRVAAGLPFDRAIWRHLAGEVLWLAAAEIPQIETTPEALFCLLGVGPAPCGGLDRSRRAPIWQAHYGSRDLAFGTAFYRPGDAGYNDVDDVTCLADYLGALDPGPWTADALAALPGLGDEAERTEELELVKEWLPALQDLYQHARLRRRVIVCEVVGGQHCPGRGPG
jgi:hypothetical protein